MKIRVAVVGGGIGGLAAALACTRAGASVQLLEQASVFGEVGAGVQLGPNVVRILQDWGLGDALSVVAAFPKRLEVRDALSTDVLGVLPLGQDMVNRYGAAYATIARPDLHRLLVGAVQRSGSADLLLARQVNEVAQNEQGVKGVQGVQVHTTSMLGQGPETFHADVLVGADGLWSMVRSAVVNDGLPRASGHLAYRAMVRQADLPASLRSQEVTVWMGPLFHVVQYPVRGGHWLNVVAIVQGELQGDLHSWDHSANAADLRALLGSAATPLKDLIDAIGEWRLWPLCERAPMRSAAEHAKGCIALLGDAAHPMRPYLAQGAGMAIEDAAKLAHVLGLQKLTVEQALQTYANARWQRNARVQARAVRNGEIFHATGLKQRARDAALKLLGKHLLDVPWLYRGVP